MIFHCYVSSPEGKSTISTGPFSIANCGCLPDGKCPWLCPSTRRIKTQSARHVSGVSTSSPQSSSVMSWRSLGANHWASFWVTGSWPSTVITCYTSTDVTHAYTNIYIYILYIIIYIYIYIYIQYIHLFIYLLIYLFLFIFLYIYLFIYIVLFIYFYLFYLFIYLSSIYLLIYFKHDHAYYHVEVSTSFLRVSSGLPGLNDQRLGLGLVRNSGFEEGKLESARTLFQPARHPIKWFCQFFGGKYMRKWWLSININHY